jgi:hypothetical protein
MILHDSTRPIQGTTERGGGQCQHHRRLAAPPAAPAGPRGRVRKSSIHVPWDQAELLLLRRPCGTGGGAAPSRSLTPSLLISMEIHEPTYEKDFHTGTGTADSTHGRAEWRRRPPPAMLAGILLDHEVVVVPVQLAAAAALSPTTQPHGFRRAILTSLESKDLTSLESNDVKHRRGGRTCHCAGSPRGSSRGRPSARSRGPPPSTPPCAWSACTFSPPARAMRVGYSG